MEFTYSPTPSISGTAALDQTLTADPGLWSPEPDSLTYQWNRGGTPIDRATDSTYLLGQDDIGTTITVTVTGSKPGYATTEATSEPTAPVTALEFTDSPTPSISGTAARDQTLTADPGTWSPEPDSLTYQWSRGGTPIDGATDSTYLLGQDDIGTTVTVTVTGTRTGYTTESRTSDPTDPITAG